MTQWSPEPGLQGQLARAGTQAPSWLLGSAPGTLCSWDALTCGVQPANLGRDPGTLEGVLEAEPDSSARLALAH